MLYLKKLIGNGATRYCYAHPDDPTKCVKVAKNLGGRIDVIKEVNVAALVYPILSAQIVSYKNVLVKTDRGDGLECDLVRNADGSIAKSIAEYRKTAQLPDSAVREINRFTKLLILHDLFFYDFNLGNFVVQENANGTAKIFFIDLKSFHHNGYLGFLKLEAYITPLARSIIFRRLRRFYRDIGVPFPHDRLCRIKFFSTFFVKIKLGLKQVSAMQSSVEREVD